MKNTNFLSAIFVFAVAETFLLPLTAKGNPVGNSSQPSIEEGLEYTSVDYSNTESSSQRPNCSLVEYELSDVAILKNNDLLLISENITVPSSDYQRKNGRLFICLSSHQEKENQILLKCSELFDYKKHEYRILPNRSAMVGKKMIPKGEYELKGDVLSRCAPETEEPAVEETVTLQDVSNYAGQVGTAISIISLMAHLSMFIFLPALRNVQGYNLASLSVAFLLAYSLVLIGQIKQVTGSSCVISAVFQQSFFLAAFFWMNVLAFDVWRTLTLATEKLVTKSQNSRKRHFIWYSLYAWGVPLLITIISVTIDNSDNVPEDIKPHYGKRNVCWMTSRIGKIIFFVVPTFTLILVNVFFFIVSSWMIFSNTMKVTKDQSKQTVKLNYILYLKLAIMMGLTWLVALIAVISKNHVIWFIFNLLNSLQGLFLFLLFTCTKRVRKLLAANLKSANCCQ